MSVLASVGEGFSEVTLLKFVLDNWEFFPLNTSLCYHESYSAVRTVELVSRCYLGGVTEFKATPP